MVRRAQESDSSSQSDKISSDKIPIISDIDTKPIGSNAHRFF